MFTGEKIVVRIAFCAIQLMKPKTMSHLEYVIYQTITFDETQNHVTFRM